MERPTYADLRPVASGAWASRYYWHKRPGGGWEPAKVHGYVVGDGDEVLSAIGFGDEDSTPLDKFHGEWSEMAMPDEERA